MSDEEHIDFDPCDKDAPESKTAAKSTKKAADAKEKNFQDAIAEKAAKETAQKKINAYMAKMSDDDKAGLLAALGVVSPGSAPRRSDYDHETKQKNLVKNTAPVRVHMEKLKDDYEAVFYMGSLCDYWKSLMPLDRAQTNEHTAFLRHFKKDRHLYGLPEVIPASPGSKNVSRGVTPFVNEDEEAGAGAGSP